MEITENAIKETRKLRYQFEDHEIEQLGKDLSEMVQSHSELELEKKMVMKSFNEALKSKMKFIHEVARKVNDGYEDREVACAVEMNNPVYGRKKITRLDTGDYWDEPMCDDEYDLFNQESEGSMLTQEEVDAVMEILNNTTGESWEEE